jgi:hypothetical protein
MRCLIFTASFIKGSDLAAAGTVVGGTISPLGAPPTRSQTAWMVNAALTGQ